MEDKRVKWRDQEAGMVQSNKCVPCLLDNTAECFLMKSNPNAGTQVFEESSKPLLTLHFSICTEVSWQ